MVDSSFTFMSTAEKGPVSAILTTPASAAAVVVFAHGAGADMQHAHMTSIARALEERHIATLRYNFPFMEKGSGRTDAMAVCLDTIEHALDLARAQIPGLPLFMGGHSFGGRMSSHHAAKRAAGDVRGLIHYSFPLHPAKKPDRRRAEHLREVALPMLFISGTRDNLADPALLESVVAKIPHATLHWLDTADHGFRILKRARRSTQDVYDEAAGVVAHWIDTILAE